MTFGLPPFRAEQEELVSRGIIDGQEDAPGETPGAAGEDARAPKRTAQSVSKLHGRVGEAAGVAEGLSQAEAHHRIGAWPCKSPVLRGRVR